MKKKVLIFDTSVHCVWLKVPGKETCGPEENLLTYVDVAYYYASAEFEVEIFTGDQGLKAYEPSTVLVKPRRRQ